jgi:hypothetical protein
MHASVYDPRGVLQIEWLALIYRYGGVFDQSAPEEDGLVTWKALVSPR